MFITNGFQALVDYRPAHKVIFASTLRDKKSKPSFEPDGRVVLSILDNAWVLDIHSSHENRLLAVALTKHFICRNSESLVCPDAVERALCQISSYGILVRKLTPIVEKEESFIHSFQFAKTLKKEVVKKDEVISTVVHALKNHHRRFDDIYKVNMHDFKGQAVKLVDVQIFVYGGKEETLMISVDNQLFLTNLTNTPVNRTTLQQAIEICERLKGSLPSCSKSFTHVTMHTLSMLVKSQVKLRPAFLITRDDGELSLVHRPFLNTEKSFEDIRAPLKIAASMLKRLV